MFILYNILGIFFLIIIHRNQHKNNKINSSKRHTETTAYFKDHFILRMGG